VTLPSLYVDLFFCQLDGLQDIPHGLVQIFEGAAGVRRAAPQIFERINSAEDGHLLARVRRQHGIDAVNRALGVVRRCVHLHKPW
jgi:hypothetical protein